MFKSLKCECSVKIYEYITDAPIYYYIIMEYYDTDLQTILNNTLDINDGLNRNQIRKILFQLNYIFNKMYSLKIILWDLKQNNIFIKYTNDELKEFDIKLGDYGFTKEVSSTKKKRNNVGSFYFITPEVIKEKYNNKSDLWNLSVIIYYFVTKDYLLILMKKLLKANIKIRFFFKLEIIKKYCWKIISCWYW